jgi:hypothetical protein
VGVHIVSCQVSLNGRWGKDGGIYTSIPFTGVWKERFSPISSLPIYFCFLLAIIVCNGSTSTAKHTTAGPTSSTCAWILGLLVRFFIYLYFIYCFSNSSGFLILQFVVSVLLWFVQKLLPSTLWAWASPSLMLLAAALLFIQPLFLWGVVCVCYGKYQKTR